VVRGTENEAIGGVYLKNWLEIYRGGVRIRQALHLVGEILVPVEKIKDRTTSWKKATTLSTERRHPSLRGEMIVTKG